MNGEVRDGFQGAEICLLANGLLWVSGARINQGCKEAYLIDLIVRQFYLAKFGNVEPTIGRTFRQP